ncbi:MAG: hypothetical protein ACLUDU_18820, partial [Butyricimonas faecihominis]
SPLCKGELEGVVGKLKVGNPKVSACRWKSKISKGSTAKPGGSWFTVNSYISFIISRIFVEHC